jgi:DNA-binding LacI/PurR family transcriptional regulator
LKDVPAEAGFDVKDGYIYKGNWSSVGVQAIEKLFEQYPEMDVVFVANVKMAFGVLQSACQRGLRSPEDLGIVGFDNIAESAYF